MSTGGPITTDFFPVPLFGVPLLCLLLDSQVSTSCTPTGRLFINSQCLLLTRITVTDPVLQSLEPVLSNWSFTQGPVFLLTLLCHCIALNERRQRLPMPTRPFWYASGKCCWVLLHTGTCCSMSIPGHQLSSRPSEEATLNIPRGCCVLYLQ